MGPPARAGRVQAHQRLVLTERLGQIDNLEETVARFDQPIEQSRAPCEEATQLLDTLPGVGQETAAVLVAERGADMRRFPTARHLAAWAGLAPGNPESAGKPRSGRTRKGNQALRQGLMQAAHAAAHTKETYWAAPYPRLAARRGRKRALVAVARAILVIA